MIGPTTLGAHWPALVAPPNSDNPGTVEWRLERALAAAGAVAWEWDVGTGESNLSAGTANVGDALTARLGRSMHGDSISVEPASEDVLGSLEAAFRRCARERKPTYEAARYDFGDGAPMYFDRLVLPMSMQEQTITHLVGVALFGGPTV